MNSRTTSNRLKRLVRDPVGVLRILHRRMDPVHREEDRVRREEDRLSEFTGPSGYWSELRAYQLAFLTQMGLKPQHSLLDVACGPLQGGIAFISYLDPGRYVGVDICETALTEAYKQIVKFGLADKSPWLIHSDRFEIDALKDRRFDFAWCCQTMYIFTPPVLDQFFATVSARLKADGVLFGDILTQEDGAPVRGEWKGYTQIQYSLEAVEESANRHGLTMTCVGPIHKFGYPTPYILRFNEMLRFEKRSAR